MRVIESALHDAESGLFSFPFPGCDGEARCFLSARSLGPMTYDPANLNRDAVFGALGLGGKVAGIALAHSKLVHFARTPADVAPLSGDGILASDEGIVPCVTVADCMPIWLFSPDTGLFGVLHSGWKGTGILAAGVAALRERGASDLRVVLGPHIRACCYSVDADRAAAFSGEFGSLAVRRGPSGQSLDLLEANIAIAERSGVTELAWIDACTACDDRLGSYRREGPERFTRMAAFCVKGALARRVGKAGEGA